MIVLADNPAAVDGVGVGAGGPRDLEGHPVRAVEKESIKAGITPRNANMTVIISIAGTRTSRARPVNGASGTGRRVGTGEDSSSQAIIKAFILLSFREASCCGRATVRSEPSPVPIDRALLPHVLRFSSGQTPDLPPASGLSAFNVSELFAGTAPRHQGRAV